MLARCAVIATAMLAVSACAQSPAHSPPKFTASDTPAAAAPGSPILDLSAATAASPTRTDASIVVTPRLYTDVGDPCASVVETVSVAKVEPACGIPFVKLHAVVVPAATLVDQYSATAGPKTVAVQRGISTDQATAVASAFYASDAVRVWAVSLGGTSVIPLIDGFGQSADPVNLALSAKPVRFVTTASCVFPTSVRVVSVSADVRQYVQTLGWVAPSSIAVVATYQKCDGLQVTFQDGTTTSLLAHTQAVSIVITGHVAQTAPFGPLWIEDGWAPCGTTALHAVCG